MSSYLISLTIGIPFVGSLVEVFIRSDKSSFLVFKWFALITSLMASLIGIFLVMSMSKGVPGLQVNEIFSWIGSYAISYDVGLDGFNAPLILLIAVVFPLLIVFEWNRERGSKGIFGLFLLLQSCFFGVIFAQDLFLSFFFWSFSALPLYFLLAIWGGGEREKAAFRFLMTASIGNVFLFLSLILIYYSVEPHTFSIKELLGGRIIGEFEILGESCFLSLTAFVFMILGISFRIPIWPLHGWFTFLATQAPASVFVIFAGILTPVGLYLLSKFSFSLFPVEFMEWSKVILTVGALNVVFGSIISVAQRELRLLMAYLTLAQCGVILIGFGSLDSAGVVGGVYQLLVIGLGLSGFGLFIGAVRSRKGHSAFLNEEGESNFGGWIGSAPVLALVTSLLMASLVGLPGLGGFVGQSLTMMGSFSVSPVTVLIVLSGVLVMTFALFAVFRNVFLGQPKDKENLAVDLSMREKSLLMPIVGCLLFLGILPKPLLDLVRPSILTLLSLMK